MCCKVRASEVPVLDLEIKGSNAQQKISNEISKSLLEDKPGAIVLGCAGMTDLSAQLTKHHQVPIIDGVSVAVGFAAALVRLSQLK